MASKQEKLAAARRKLKEFQGKNRETDTSRHKYINEILLHQPSKDSSQPSSESSGSCTPIINENKDLENIQRDLKYYYPSGPNDQINFTEDYKNHRKISDSYSNKSDSPVLSLGGSHSPNSGSDKNLLNDKPGSEMNFSEIGKLDFESKYSVSNNPVMSHNGSHTVATLGTSNVEYPFEDRNNHQNVSNSFSKDSSQLVSSPPMLNENNVMSNAVSIKQNIYSYANEANEFFNNKFNTSNALDEVVKPLQMELQNHAQTINILIQQRTEAQNALAQVQNSLIEKSGEISNLKEQVTYLTSLVDNINQIHKQAIEKIEKLEREKDEFLQRNNELMTNLDALQEKFDSKEEECSEFKRKYEEKNKECQQLLYNLHDAQSQLSLCQIKIQEFSSGEHSAFGVQVSQLQNENLSLKQRIQELEKQTEVDNTEKLQSSQKFHSYVQQCNSQLSALNSQVQNLTAENDKLRKENSILLENISELENNEEEEPLSQDYTIEIADLNSQISVLSEANQQLRNDLAQKGEELKDYQKQLEEKDSEVKDLSTLVQEVEAENKKLLTEIETPKANERLLAAMESDKVAAAKAVSQNQKLKEQVADLEKAFMKLSEEKLQLTNELGHEKHVNKELQGRLKSLESHHHDHDHDDDHECHHHEMEGKPEPLVNDSNEIEELRNIIRQLQDDKIELKDRLNSFMLSQANIQEENNEKRKCEHGHGHDHDHGHDHNHEHDHDHGHEHNHGDELEPGRDPEKADTANENTKLVLQQMEEKLKRTMSEIAKLDEEKEKLEHLVLQLQGETETIGEYITLYQKQRMMLRQRSQEKDIQLIQLSRDKEELRSKLENLDELVQHLLAERENNGLDSGKLRSSLEFAEEASENTAVKIRALINEIGSTNLVNSNSVAFEHCSCCSGRLITI